jgi:hypothetical protein
MDIIDRALTGEWKSSREIKAFSEDYKKESHNNQSLDFTKVGVKVWRLASKPVKNKVFGVIQPLTSAGDEEREEFDYSMLINSNDLQNIHLQYVFQMDFYASEDKLQVGDILIFSQEEKEHRFRVARQESFSEPEGIVNEYELVWVDGGFHEHLR